MNDFISGFTKIAGKVPRVPKARVKGKGRSSKGADGFFSSVGNFISGAGDGLKSSGNVKLKDHLNPMTGFNNLGKAFDAKNANIRGQYIGRALPSLGATGAYAYGAKTVFDKATGADRPQYSQGYGPYTY